MGTLKNENIRTAVILCGGKGTRLGKITQKIPKSLVKIKGKPIIWYILNMLKKNNFTNFILPTGYKEIQIKQYLNKKIFRKFNLKIISTGVNAPIAKRIYKINKYIKSDDFLLLNGDAIFNFDLYKIYSEHIKNKKTYITFLGSETILPYGTITLSKKLVKSFERDVIFNAVKVSNKKQNTAHIYSGMAIIRSKLITKKIKNLKNFETEFYPGIIKKFICKFKRIDGFWHSIDNIKDIKILKNDIYKKSQINKLLKKLM